MTAPTYQMAAEYTDTFGGEANYCWVTRATVNLPEGASAATISRRIKAALGISGMKGRAYQDGDRWEFRPYNSCTIAFAHVMY